MYLPYVLLSRRSSDFDHYVDDMVQFSKVVLPAKVPLSLHSDETGGGREASTADAEGGSPSLRRGSSDGCGGVWKLSVVAHSMGGLVAVKAALKEPLLFDGVRHYHLPGLHFVVFQRQGKQAEM